MSNLNDPRVLFAAERTLLAWSRTSLTLMAFGFAVERFSLFAHMLQPDTGSEGQIPALLAGVMLLALGVLTSLLSVAQYRRVISTLNPSEIPQGYWVSLSVALNVGLGVLGMILIALLVGQRF